MRKIASLLCTFLACIIDAFTEEYPSLCPEIVSKAQWKGKPATKINYCLIPAKYVVVHHTAGQQCTTAYACSILLQNLQNYQMNLLHYWDVGYNFLVGGDGRIYEGAGWHKESAYDYKSTSLVLGFIGNFIYELPNNEQLQTAKAFLNCAVKIQELDVYYRLIGGSQIFNTQSPGRNLFNEIKKWSHFAIKPDGDALYENAGIETFISTRRVSSVSAAELQIHQTLKLLFTVYIIINCS